MVEMDTAQAAPRRALMTRAELAARLAALPEHPSFGAKVAALRALAKVDAEETLRGEAGREDGVAA
jgi:hypothetical protein